MYKLLEIKTLLSVFTWFAKFVYNIRVVLSTEGLDFHYFQLEPESAPHIVVVISPLVSLMDDQKEHLQEMKLTYLVNHNG